MRPAGARHELGEQPLIEFARAVDISGGEEVRRRPLTTEPGSLGFLRRGDRGCQLVELGSGERGTPGLGVHGGLLEGDGDLLARPGDTEREVPRPFLWIGHDPRERRMGRASVTADAVP